MKIRKMWGAFLMTLTAAGLLSGCQQEASVSEDGVVELTFYNADGQDDPWTDPVAEVLTEKTGVRLKTEYPVAADDQTVALMIAAQDYPDMIYAKGDANSLIDAGALIDMTDLIEEYGPNIKKMYGDEFEKLRYSEEDPSIYQLSSYAVGGTFLENSGTAQIQWAVLKENNYEIPDTLEKFEKMIKDYMAAHPTTEEGMPTIGLSLSAADWHWMITLGNPSGYIAEGAPDNGQWLIDEDYNAMYKFRSDKVREYYRWLNRMYHEGVLDPEFATQTYEDYIAKIASGRVVALTDTDWEKLIEGAGIIGNSELIIDDTPGISIAEMRSKCRKYKLEHDLKLVIIDYLQLMSGSGRSTDSRQQEISDISRSLKALARELSVPVIALSQLSEEELGEDIMKEVRTK